MFRLMQLKKGEEESEDYSQILMSGYLLIQIFVRAAVIAEFNQTVLPSRPLKPNLGVSEKLINQTAIRILAV